MKVLVFIGIAFVVFGCTCNRNEHKTKSINETITSKIDLTGDNIPEKVTLILKSHDIFSPFLWEMTISDNNGAFFEVSGFDTDIDINFNDKGYLQGCYDYLSCKKKWYYEEKINIIVPYSKVNIKGVTDRRQTNTLYNIGYKFLVEDCKITDNDASIILKNIEKKIINNEAVFIMIPMAPASGSVLMVFSPEIRKLVPIYEQ